MTRRLVISPTADAELQSIIDYIAVDSPERAIRFVDELTRRLRGTLLTFPDSGAPYRAGSRYLVISRYVFVYEHLPETDQINVLHVYAGAQDWKDS